MNIFDLKTNIQTNFMFYVRFENAPTGVNPSLIVKSTTIPALDTDLEIINTFDQRFALPKRVKITHEWQCTILKDKVSPLFVNQYAEMVTWFKTSQTDQLSNTKAYIYLFDLAKNINTKTTLINVRPISIGEMPLDTQSTDALLEYPVTFAFDDIILNDLYTDLENLAIKDGLIGIVGRLLTGGTP